MKKTRWWQHCLRIERDAKTALPLCVTLDSGSMWSLLEMSYNIRVISINCKIEALKNLENVNISYIMLYKKHESEHPEKKTTGDTSFPETDHMENRGSRTERTRDNFFFLKTVIS